MRDYLIAIPSKSRADNLATLRLLKKLDPTKIYFFVEPQDYSEYLEVLKDRTRIVNIQRNDQGIAYARNFIMQYMSTMTDFLWMLDDDILQFFIRGEFNAKKQYYRLEPWDNAQKIFDEGYDLIQANPGKLAQIAVSYKASNWCYMQDKKFNGRAWAVVGYNMNLVRKQNVRFDEKLTAFEDYDMTAQLLRNNLKNIVWYKYAFANAKMSKTKGGMFKFYKNKQIFDRNCDYLIRKWGSAYVKKFYNKTHDMWEPQFSWNTLHKIKAKDLRGFI